MVVIFTNISLLKHGEFGKNANKRFKLQQSLLLVCHLHPNFSKSESSALRLGWIWGHQDVSFVLSSPSLLISALLNSFRHTSAIGSLNLVIILLRYRFRVALPETFHPHTEDGF